MTAIAPLLPDYAFKVSYKNSGIAHETQVTEDEIQIVSEYNGVTARYGDQMTVMSAGADTSKEFSGTKISQRTELGETQDSDDGNTLAEETWYGFSLYIDPSSMAPSDFDDSPTTRVTLFQFHQRDEDGKSDRPAIMVQWTPDGDVIVSFETAIGKRTYTVVDGGEDATGATGKWLDFKFGMDWSTTDAWTKVYVREEGETDYTLEVLDESPNTSTGSIYTKFGVYRSFLERDPALEASTTTVFYDGVRRATSEEEIDQTILEGNAYGSDYDDVLEGSKLGELLYGLGGDDLFIADRGVDKYDGGTGVDTVSFEELVGTSTVDLEDQNGAKGKAEDAIFIDIENLIGSDEHNYFYGDDADNLFVGLGGNDILDGRAGNDILEGGKGRDTLVGGEGDDLLLGGIDNDTLKGSDGDDILIGGKGKDKSWGGAGSDAFVFQTDDMDGSIEVIYDFTHDGTEQDVLDLSDLNVLGGGETRADWIADHVTSSSAGVRLSIDGTMIIVYDHDNVGTDFAQTVLDGLLL